MEQESVIRVLVAGNYPIFRAALSKLLEGQPGFEVVGQAPIGQEVALQADEKRPDIVLINIAIHSQLGLECARELAARSIPVRTVILAATLEKAEIIQALQYGVQGIVPRESAPEDLFAGLRNVMKGELWIGHENVSHLVQVVRRILPGQKGDTPRENFGLTRRELEVVATIVSGFSNRDIAEKFNLSEHTVKRHIANIFDKLGASNRMEVALMAISHHLVDEA